MQRYVSMEEQFSLSADQHLVNHIAEELLDLLVDQFGRELVRLRLDSDREAQVAVHDSVCAVDSVAQMLLRAQAIEDRLAQERVEQLVAHWVRHRALAGWLRFVCVRPLGLSDERLIEVAHNSVPIGWIHVRYTQCERSALWASCLRRSASERTQICNFILHAHMHV